MQLKKIDIRRNEKSEQLISSKGINLSKNIRGFNGKVYQIYNKEIKLILLNFLKNRKIDHGPIHSIRPK